MEMRKEKRRLFTHKAQSLGRCFEIRAFRENMVVHKIAVKLWTYRNSYVGHDMGKREKCNNECNIFATSTMFPQLFRTKYKTLAHY